MTRLILAIALLACAMISAIMILPYPHAWESLGALAIVCVALGGVLLPGRRFR